MKLYVCYGTWTAGAQLHRHPCGEAYKALKEAGHRPRVLRTYGLGLLGDAANRLSPGRRKVQELTGNSWVPVLVLDDDTVIQGSAAIIAWAQDGEAAGAAPQSQAAPAQAAATAAPAGAAGTAAPAGAAGTAAPVGAASTPAPGGPETPEGAAPTDEPSKAP